MDDGRPKASSKEVGCRCLFVGYGSAVVGQIFAAGRWLKIRVFKVRVKAWDSRELPFPCLGQSNPLQRMNHPLVQLPEERYGRVGNSISR